MLKKKKSQGLVTRQFVKETVENAVDELAQATEKAFQKTATRKDLRAVRREMATKKDLQEMENRIKSYFENRDAEIQGAHEDELDTIAEKKEAPAAWKSIPRRLKTVETEVEKIKDHIELP